MVWPYKLAAEMKVFLISSPSLIYLKSWCGFLGLLPMLKSCIFTFLFTHSGYFLLSFVCSIYSLPFSPLLTAVDAHFPFWWTFIYSPCNPVSYGAIKFSKLIEGNLNPPVCKFIVSRRHRPEHWFGMKYLNKYEIVVDIHGAHRMNHNNFGLVWLMNLDP